LKAAAAATEQEAVLAGADARIERHRKGRATLDLQLLLP
jgi:hypothetical protein